MKIAELSEKLMGMSPEVWERHANKWSGWSRVASLPLIALAVWSRIYIGVWAVVPLVLALLWLWINPRLFPAPEDTDNWMTKGVFGERVWLNRQECPIPRHHIRAGFILNGLSGLAALPYLYGLIWLSVWATVFGTITIMLTKLWFLDRMVWLYDDMRHQNPDYAAWMKENPSLG